MALVPEDVRTLIQQQVVSELKRFSRDVFSGSPLLKLCTVTVSPHGYATNSIQSYVCVCVCVCVCVASKSRPLGRVSPSLSLSLSLSLSMRTRTRARTHIKYKYITLCVCVCVCTRARAYECMYACCTYVCICMHACIRKIMYTYAQSRAALRLGHMTYFLVYMYIYMQLKN